MEDQLATVSTYNFTHEAEIDRGFLESEGITAFVTDGHIVNANWLLSNAVGGVKLQVRKSDLERAQLLLAKAGDSPAGDSGWGICPECGGANLEPVSDRSLFNISWLLAGFPFFRPRNRLRCRDCRATVRSS